ncbi:MAG: Si-specific NAD(P)(+) transhydrogenase [Chlamydiia bacterium]|nr:Si-specific NAD(P)(+) transhydrogenase [Chlamydiia bacterium]
MKKIRAQIVVIGSGPSGQKAAIQAAKLGKSVIVIEKDPGPGGACLYSGTIPSKSLREAILDYSGYHERSYYASDQMHREISINDLNYTLRQVISQEREIILRQFKKNNIELIQGTARFETAHSLVVFNANFQLQYQIHADTIILATGSKPSNPLNVPFDDEVILDSTRLLSIGHLPKSMIVLGGGIIGSEYASFFAALGTDVILIDKRTHLLPLLDKEIARHLQTVLTGLGMRFMGNKRPVEIRRENDRAHVEFDDGTHEEAEVLLYALGRVANVDSLHIGNAGLAVNQRGHIPVNALFQTVVPHIYGVGDVIGGPALASTSMEQGRLAARHACGIETHHFPKIYPIGIYTIPEISSCGYTESTLKELGFRYEIGRAYYYEIARSHISGDNVGLFKILFHAETLEILGIHVIGRNATEVIHIGQVAMANRAHIDFFIDQVFNYPTYAEGYRVAALNGYNKVKHRK